MDRLASWFEAAQVWLAEHPWLITFTSVGSVLMFVGSLLAVPWIIVRARSDALVRVMRQSDVPQPHSPWWWIRNGIGLVLLAMGLLMLITPGQGLLTILVALALLSLPGKRRALGWLLHHQKLLHTLNRVRRRAGREPFAPPP